MITRTIRLVRTKTVDRFKVLEFRPSSGGRYLLMFQTLCIK